MRKIFLVALAAAALPLARSLPDTPSQVEAGTALKLDLGGLVDRSELVVEGRVVGMRAIEESSGFVVTEYTLDVGRSFWGDPAAARVVRIPGGVLPDGRGMIVPGMPRLAQGEEAILFLSRAGSTGARVPVGLAQGKFSVRRTVHGARVLARDHSDLELIDPATGAIAEPDARALWDYAETVARIESLAQARRNREAEEGR